MVNTKRPLRSLDSCSVVDSRAFPVAAPIHLEQFVAACHMSTFKRGAYLERTPASATEVSSSLDRVCVERAANRLCDKTFSCGQSKRQLKTFLCVIVR